MIPDKAKKTIRLEARTTPALYALVQRAANLQGRSVSEFVISSAQQAAYELIEQRESIDLVLADQERFAAALLNPAPVSPALQRAAAAHRKLTAGQP